MNFKTFSAILAAVFLLSALTFNVLAQKRISRVMGNVTNSSNSTVEGVTVILTNEETNVDNI